MVGWVAGAYLAKRVVTAVNGALDEALNSENAESGLRAAFDEWVMRELDRLEHDPQRAAQIGEALRSALRHGVVAGWLDDAWHRVRWAAEMDAANPDGRLAALARAALDNAGQVLAEDPGARAVATAERALLAELDGSCRTPIGGHARHLPDGRLALTGLVARADGSFLLRRAVEGERADAAEMGADLGASLRADSPRDVFA